jgi:hypothetical protein
MPRLLSQILLATLMFPLGFMVYMAVYIALNDYLEYDYQHRSNVLSGFVTWGFVGVYWYRVWRPSVPWNARRARGTFIAVAVALVAGIVLGALGWMGSEYVGSAIGSITAPLAWLAQQSSHGAKPTRSVPPGSANSPSTPSSARNAGTASPASPKPAARSAGPSTRSASCSRPSPAANGTSCANPDEWLTASSPDLYPPGVSSLLVETKRQITGCDRW